MGNTSRGALTVSGNYGAVDSSSTNPSCKTHTARPCPVSRITFDNITQGAGTQVAVLLDFEGLKTNAIEGVAIHGVHLKGPSKPSCSWRHRTLNATGQSRVTLSLRQGPKQR